MCDDKTNLDNDEFLRKKSGLTRREFSQMTAAAVLMAVLPKVANAKQVAESDVVIKTPDGEADCYFVHPVSGPAPAVLIWPDILGLRPAFRQMGKRLAESGYAVLVVNPYYRDEKSPVVGEGASYSDEEVRTKVRALAGNLSAETNVTDAEAFIGWLDQQEAVDTSKKMGTTGYCMGGPMVFRTAAAVPDRVGAAGTFHGGGLVTDQENSPHLLIPQMQAQFLIAIAENDDEKEPKVKYTLAKAFNKAGLEAEIEVYDGAMHGWCPPDSRAYNEGQAEQAWSRMLSLFNSALV